MIISQLMEQLADLLARYGDIPVEIGYTMGSIDGEEYAYHAPIVSCGVSPFDTFCRVTLLTDILVMEEEEDDD